MNTPNLLSLLRILLIPVLMFFYLATFIPYGKFIALVLFIGAALTDLFDGKIARKNNQVTDLGKLLDPIADKLLYTCGLFLIVIDGTIPAPYGIIALTILFARDTLINGIRQIAATKGKVIAAYYIGKLKAVIVYIYICMFIFLAGTRIIAGTSVTWLTTFNDIFAILCYIGLGIGTFITIWSAVEYVAKNKDVFADSPQTPATSSDAKISDSPQTPANKTTSSAETLETSSDAKAFESSEELPENKQEE